MVGPGIQRDTNAAAFALMTSVSIDGPLETGTSDAAAAAGEILAFWAFVTASDSLCGRPGGAAAKARAGKIPALSFA